MILLMRYAFAHLLLEIGAHVFAVRQNCPATHSRTNGDAAFHIIYRVPFKGFQENGPLRFEVSLFYNVILCS